MRHSGTRDCATSWVAAHEGQAGADVEELPDPGLDDQEAQHALLERAHGGRRWRLITGAVAARTRAALRSASKLFWPPYR